MERGKGGREETGREDRKLEELQRTWEVRSGDKVEDSIEEIIIRWRDKGSFESNKSILIQDLFSGVDISFINPNMMDLGIGAAYEPLIVHHFGSSKEMIDEFTRTMERHMISSVGMEVLLAAEADYPLISLHLHMLSFKLVL
uniref:Uncharacterized protein n=1 Tax=Oryza barthii TaxID=65489 RepID=A0A0D3GFU4_9ORYZ